MGATIRLKIPDNTKLTIKGLLKMLSLLSQQYHAVEDAKRKTERAKFKVPFQRDFSKRPLRQSDPHKDCNHSMPLLSSVCCRKWEYLLITLCRGFLQTLF